MEEHFQRYITREEDFIDRYYTSACKAAAFLKDEWVPNPHCDDTVRGQQQYFIGTGELTHLVFDGASIYCGDDGWFSSVQIALKSSTRLVTVRVGKVGDDLVVEKAVDREPASNSDLSHFTGDAHP